MTAQSSDQPARDFTAYARDWDASVGLFKRFHTGLTPHYVNASAWDAIEQHQAMLAHEGELP